MGYLRRGCIEVSVERMTIPIHRCHCDRSLPLRRRRFPFGPGGRSPTCWGLYDLQRRPSQPRVPTSPAAALTRLQPMPATRARHAISTPTTSSGAARISSIETVTNGPTPPMPFADRSIDFAYLRPSSLTCPNRLPWRSSPISPGPPPRRYRCDHHARLSGIDITGSKSIIRCSSSTQEPRHCAID